MPILRPLVHLGTHEVTNPPPPLGDIDFHTSDRALVDAVRAASSGHHDKRLSALGRRAGSAEAISWGVEANRNPPVLERSLRPPN